MLIFLNDSVENIVGKGENAGFSPFPTMFSTLSKTNFNFSAKSNLSSANTINAFNLDMCKNLSFGKVK